ncbi:MAG: family 78 glycoside hydrolase catalytic domain [Pseudomonadales bacterium]|nr:family 78 glycoside hydrolase catalytic domain [Pseudomonadales bacterium]
MHGAPLRLRSEYLANPLGIDVPNPRLSWWINDQRAAELQTAFQIIAAPDRDSLAADRGELWDSGRVEGRQTSAVEYGGRLPEAGTPVWWKVRSFDSDGLPSPWSEPASFEQGLSARSAWRGEWIAAPLKGSKSTGVPVPLLRRDFELSGAVRSARLHIAVLGAAALQVNGARVAAGEQIGGWVDFRRRIEYRSFELTEHLVTGTNSLAVLLADGCYAGAICADERQQYGARPALLVQLDVWLTDGSRIWISSDRRWQWRPSWIICADPVRGESVDGRAYRDDWTSVPEDTEAEVAAVEEADPWLPVVVERRLAAEIDRLIPAPAGAPKRLRETPGTLLSRSTERRAATFEFSQPQFGRVQVRLQAPRGRVLHIRYGLAVNQQGELCGPTSEDLYTTRGLETGEFFEATFATHGFRFVELSGDLRVHAMTVSACAIRRDLAVSGEFLCDHPLLNQAFADIAGEQRRLAQAVPLQGIAAVQRIGATAGFAAGAGVLLHNLDAAVMCLKWLQDMADAQREDGDFPAAVPLPPASAGIAGEGGAPGSDAFVEVLWQLYRHAGDLRALQKFYPVVQRFIGGLVERSPGLIRADAEHFSAGSPVQGVRRNPAPVPVDVRSTAWFFRSVKLAARMAGVLGRLTDLEDFEELASGIRAAFRRRFVTAEGRVVGDSLATYALTLGFGLLESGERDLAARQLFALCDAELSGEQPVEIPRASGLFPVLTNLGRVDLAYKLLLQGLAGESGVREGSAVQRLIEAGVGDWLYRSLAGFDFSRDLSEQHNAFRVMRIQPLPPLGVAFSGDGPPVRVVEAALDTLNGRYEVRWQITEEAFELTVLVPGNCEAEITLPDETCHEVDAGQHSFRMAFGEAGDGIPILREVG